MPIPCYTGSGHSSNGSGAQCAGEGRGAIGGSHTDVFGPPEKFQHPDIRNSEALGSTTTSDFPTGGRSGVVVGAVSSMEREVVSDGRNGFSTERRHHQHRSRRSPSSVALPRAPPKPFRGGGGASPPSPISRHLPIPQPEPMHDPPLMPFRGGRGGGGGGGGGVGNPSPVPQPRPLPIPPPAPFGDAADAVKPSPSSPTLPIPPAPPMPDPPPTPFRGDSVEMEPSPDSPSLPIPRLLPISNPPSQPFRGDVGIISPSSRVGGRRAWTKEEDDRLDALVGVFGLRWPLVRSCACARVRGESVVFFCFACRSPRDHLGVCSIRLCRFSPF